MQTLLFLFLGALVTGAVLVIGVSRETKRALALDRRLAAPRREAARALAGPGPGGTGRPRPALGTLGRPLLRAGSMLVPVGAREREKLAGTLARAGFARRDALSLFLCCKLVAALVGAAAGALGAQAIGPVAAAIPQGAVAVFGGVVGLVVGGVVPEYVLRSKAARRARRMAAALPDALDLMVMCLESGLTFERALATVAEELAPISPSLAAEFRLIDTELRLGSSRRAVLQDYYRRTDVDGLRDFAMTLIQGDRYGTPLTQSLKNVAEAERVQRNARIAAWAARLPVLMTLPMLLLVMPGTVTLVAGPTVLSAMKAVGSLGGIGG